VVNIFRQSRNACVDHMRVPSIPGCDDLEIAMVVPPIPCGSATEAPQSAMFLACGYRTSPPKCNVCCLWLPHKPRKVRCFPPVSLILTPRREPCIEVGVRGQLGSHMKRPAIVFSSSTFRPSCHHVCSLGSSTIGKDLIFSVAGRIEQSHRATFVHAQVPRYMTQGVFCKIRGMISCCLNVSVGKIREQWKGSHRSVEWQ
jgi:hypothetical protein